MHHPAMIAFFDMFSPTGFVPFSKSLRGHNEYNAVREDMVCKSRNLLLSRRAGLRVPFGMTCTVST